jgi:hypothetical protein
MRVASAGLKVASMNVPIAKPSPPVASFGFEVVYRRRTGRTFAVSAPDRLAP